MMENTERPCDFCGEQRMSNARITAEPTVHYLDGEPVASIPSTIICRECAAEVTDYLEERKENSPAQNDADSPFISADTASLIDQLKENEQLVLDPGYGYGIRYIEGEWQQALTPLPSPPTIRTLDREEVKEIIQNSRRITLKQLDVASWEQHAERPNY